MKRIQIELFYFFPCPIGFSQEGEARLQTGVIVKTRNFNKLPQLRPAIMPHQLLQNKFQGFAM